MSPREYYEWVKRLEQEEFPGLFNEQGHVPLSRQDAARNYVLFAPSHFFEPRDNIVDGDVRLMSEALVSELKKGKTLLSVGCGEAYLERLLVSRLGVPRERVMLADVCEEVIPPGFRRYVFDMHKPWPRVEPVDYVLFPESTLINYYFSDEPLRFEGEYFRFLAREEGLYTVISRAADCLRDGGQIRIDGDSTFADAKLFVKRRLEAERKELKMRYAHEFICVDKVRNV